MYRIYIPYFFFSRLILPRNREVNSLCQFLYYTYSTINCLQYVLKPDYNIFGSFDTKYSYIFEEQISYYFISLYFQILILQTYNQLIIFVHNLLLVFLFLCSQHHELQNIAIVLLLFHDCSEPFFYLVKLFTYSKNIILQKLSFLIFIFNFNISRLIVAPYIYYLCIEKYGLTNIFNIQIVALEILYILWSNFIINTDYRLIIDF